MPTYEYRCASCGESLEVVQKFSDAPLTVCPNCSGSLRKVFSPVGVVFKGSGFYSTDNHTKPKSTTPAADKSGSASPSGDSSAHTSTAAETSSSSATASTSSSSSPESAAA